MFRKTKALIFSFIFLFLFTQRGYSSSKNTVDFIEVSGNIRVNDGSIKNYFKDCIGKKYNEDIINDILKQMYSDDYFEKINIKFKNNTIQVAVKENPMVMDVFMEGNSKIDDSTILSEISLNKRALFSKSKLKNDISRITELYKRSGRFLSGVKAQIIKKSDNRIILIFIINEGNKAKIGKIIMIGNEKIPDEDLKGALFSKENKIYKFGISTVYDPERLEYDKELLRRFYFSRGYADFEILSTVGEITRDKKKFNITFLMDEGEKYYFGDINLVNNIRKFDEKIAQKEIIIKKGDVYNQELLAQIVDKLTVAISKSGYAFIEVEPSVRKDKISRTISVDFILHPTRKTYIGNVKINGNIRTIDKVIRKEMRIEEGDPYSTQNINRSVERIRNLGFFSDVNLERTPGIDPNKIDLSFNVKEQKTGEMNLGIGYSTVDGLNANIGIKERNLMGTGTSLSANVLVSEYEQQIALSYGKPFFMNRDVFVSVNGQYSIQKEQDTVKYGRDIYGIGLSASYAISEYLGHRVFYDFSNEKIKNVSDEYKNIILEGSETISTIGQTLSYDRRDSRYDPKNGYYLSLTTSYAGLGGSKDYIRLRGNAVFYKQLYYDDLVLKLNINGGMINGLGNAVAPNDGFYLGGNSMRGFEYGGVGPRIINSTTGRPKNGDSIGGLNYYVAEAELKFPLGLPKELRIFGSFFINAGTLTGIDEKAKIDHSRIVDSGSIRSAYGFSLLWNSPLGALSFDFAWVLEKEDYDVGERFRFNFGNMF